MELPCHGVEVISVAETDVEDGHVEGHHHRDGEVAAGEQVFVGSIKILLFELAKFKVTQDSFYER